MSNKVNNQQKILVKEPREVISLISLYVININKYRIMNRFINCDCIKNKKGELIPLWKIDWKLDSEYLDKDDLENSFIVPEDRNIGDFIAETDIVKALWDLIDKKVVPCKRVIKIYSDSTGRVRLKEGDEIYV